MRVIYPPAIVPVDGPLIFLAGPIQGAPDWHSQALFFLETEAKLLEIDTSKWTIACPKRSDATWKHDFTAQVDWETHYLNLSAEKGCILFWLAKEETHHPERAYAQTTRFELAEWLTKSRSSVVLGIEPGFSGEKYIVHRIGVSMAINNTLDRLCRRALVITSFMHGQVD